MQIRWGRNLLVLALSFLMTALASSLVSISIPHSFIDTIYTVASIMFSIGMGIACTFNLSGIRNPEFFKKVKIDIISIINNFIFIFISISIFYILSKILPDKVFILFSGVNIYILFNLSFYTSVCSIFGIAYFIINFLSIHKLSLDISEKLNNK